MIEIIAGKTIIIDMKLIKIKGVIHIQMVLGSCIKRRIFFKFYFIWGGINMLFRNTHFIVPVE